LMKKYVKFVDAQNARNKQKYVEQEDDLRKSSDQVIRVGS